MSWSPASTTRCPPGWRPSPATRSATEASDDINGMFLDMLTTFLTVFAGIALLVATFSIYNTFSIIVAQRTRTAALLRAVGASRRQVLISVVIEALVVGRRGLARRPGRRDRRRRAAQGPVRRRRLRPAAGGIVVTGGTVVVAMVVGVGRDAARRHRSPPCGRRGSPPGRAARRRRRVDRHGGPLVVGAVRGWPVPCAGRGCSAASTTAPGVAGLGAVLTFVGIVVLGPSWPGPRPGAGRAVRPAVAALGVLARQNAMRNPRRTAATASALMVGVGIVTLFTVFAASVQGPRRRQLDRVVRRRSGHLHRALRRQRLQPRLAATSTTCPRSTGPSGIGSGSRPDRRRHQAADGRGPGRLERSSTSASRRARSPTSAADEIAISEATADANGWSLGDTVTVTFADGARPT